MKSLRYFAKRIIDILGSILGLMVLSPVMLLIALLIRVSTKGSVFFRQDRLGKSGKPFKIIKYRTMVIGAENLGDGLVVKSEFDQRITRVGKILRKTSLDELPQLFNVLTGHMSLVGPRPPATYFPYDGFENYPSWAKKRFFMRPGMTGLTQITVRNSVPWEDRIRVDVYYVENFSICFDIKILLRTLFGMFKTSGGIYLDYVD